MRTVTTVTTETTGALGRWGRCVYPLVVPHDLNQQAEYVSTGPAAAAHEIEPGHVKLLQTTRTGRIWSLHLQQARLKIGWTGWQARFLHGTIASIW